MVVWLRRYVPVKVVEEGEEVEGQLDPSLSLTLVEGVRVHDGGGVVEAGPTHHRPVHVPGQGKFNIYLFQIPVGSVADPDPTIKSSGSEYDQKCHRTKNISKKLGNYQ